MLARRVGGDVGRLSAVASTTPVAGVDEPAAVSTMRRRESVIQPSARIGVSIGTGLRKSTDIRAVTPQLSSATSAQAITSSRIVQTMPPWAMPSQPSKRRSSRSSVHDRAVSRWSASCRPCVVERPAGEAVVRRELEAASTSAATAVDRRAGSDVKVLDLAGLGLDEVLARLDLLAHEHREDLVGLGGVLDVDPQQRPRLRVHRRLPELVGVHLAEALEALDGQVLDLDLLDDPVALLLVWA